MIDTHAHLYLPAFDADRADVLARFAEAGGTQILLPTTDAASARAAITMADEQAGGTVRLRPMSAIHPTETAGVTDDQLAEIAEIARDTRVVAVGETGLDYYWDVSNIEDQHRSLRFHARLAIEVDKPLVLHLRDRDGREGCARDLVSILRDESAGMPPGSLRGVFHCFGGPAWLADDVMDLGFHVGLGGTLTYPKAGVADAIHAIPLDRIVLETDAPYLAPVPHRGRRNEPAYMRFVAQRLAEVRGLTTDEIWAATSANAATLFRLD